MKVIEHKTLLNRKKQKRHRERMKIAIAFYEEVTGFALNDVMKLIRVAEKRRFYAISKEEEVKCRNTEALQGKNQ